MAGEAGPRAAGRSRDALRTATDLFLEHGYERVSMNAVIAAVGGSKRDLYAEFGTKEGLFRRVIETVCQDVMGPLRALPLVDGPAERTLTAFARTLLTFLLTPRVIALQRLVMAEAGRHPDFAKDFYDFGPSSAYGAAADLLAKLTRDGELTVADPRLAGAMLCDMLVSDLQFRTLAGEDVGRPCVEERVRAGIRLFLLGTSSGKG